ncbi:hypothetical protein COHA_002744 [Chlorella ohadii]|uniref:Uncharacterized protein n=1 Tax=Chlorella ohadii TaxID=2649997 RepID=A0AAD5H4G5_9CHLO|nr:hypothetical protein COHA_002744 [Chlorella ohadii]
MRALVAILLLVLVVGALARKHEDPVTSCIKRKRCASKKFKPVCAHNVATEDTFGGFPNTCYLNCANAGHDLGVHWVKSHYYRVPKYCKTQWLAYPVECSTCSGYY